MARGPLSRKLTAAGVFESAGARVPYEIILERRANTRYSLTQRKAYLRLPLRTSAAAIAKARAEFEAWLGGALAKRAGLRAAHEPRDFADGETWRFGEHAFRLTIRRADVGGASARIQPHNRNGPGGNIDAVDAAPLLITLPQNLDPGASDEATEKLLFRMLARKVRPSVEREVRELNAAHFRIPVARVKLSATTSRWGSCSSSGTISLSTRLAGVPAFCRKAVIVHELAHGIEMNHSPRFWSLVYGAMPDYDAADAWLKREGGQLAWERVGR